MKSIGFFVAAFAILLPLKVFASGLTPADEQYLAHFNAETEEGLKMAVYQRVYEFVLNSRMAPGVDKYEAANRIA